MWPDMSSHKSTVHPIRNETIIHQPTYYSSRRAELLPEIPDGLDVLVETQHLFIHQSASSHTETQYEVLNSDGVTIFLAEETTDTTTKAWCRGTKPFDVSILIRSGHYRREVMKMDGEPRSCACGGDITLRSTKNTLGIIEHGTECSFPHYFIKDSDGQIILQIVGPTSNSCFSFDLEPEGEFNILLPEDEGTALVGKIAKYWNEKRGSEEAFLAKTDIWGIHI